MCVSLSLSVSVSLILHLSLLFSLSLILSPSFSPSLPLSVSVSLSHTPSLSPSFCLPLSLLRSLSLSLPLSLSLSLSLSLTHSCLLLTTNSTNHFVCSQESIIAQGTLDVSNVLQYKRSRKEIDYATLSLQVSRLFPMNFIPIFLSTSISFSTSIKSFFLRLSVYMPFPFRYLKCNYN